MATYYRWRKSTVSAVSHGEAVSSLNLGTFPGSFPGFTLYYSKEIETDKSTNLLNLVGDVKSVFVSVSSYLTDLGVPAEYFYFAASGENIESKKVAYCDALRVKTHGSSTPSANTTSYGISMRPGMAAAIKPVSPGPGPGPGGSSIRYVYSTSASAYPNGGEQGGYWYDQRSTVISPTMPSSSIITDNPIVTPNPTISWGESLSQTSYPVKLYEVVYSADSGASWTVAGTTATTNYQISLPAGITTIRFRVRAQDSNGQWGDYAVSSDYPVRLSPTLTVPQTVIQGQPISVSWTSVESADGYTLQRKADTDGDWVQVYSGPDLSFTETAGTWTSLQYRVCAVFGGSGGEWAASDVIPVRVPGVPSLTFSVSGQKVSAVPGFDYIIVAFQSDIPYQSFECRATKAGEDYGVGKGALVASFSATPANTQRQFEIYDDYLVKGEGDYRISLFAQGWDGSWNDNLGFIPLGEIDALLTADGKEFFVKR